MSRRAATQALLLRWLTQLMPLAVTLLASILSLSCLSAAQGPQTWYTGHTGLPQSHSTTTTLPDKTLLEGAMIPRFCQADYVEKPASAEEVAAKIRHYKDKCESEGKRLVVRASRAYYHASSDILCPETNKPEWDPAAAHAGGGKHSHFSKEGRREAESDSGTCSLILDVEKMKWIGELDREAMTVTTGATLTYNVLMEYLYPLDLALDYRHLPFYSNLTMAGMLLTGAHGSSKEKPSSFGQLVERVDWVDASGNMHSTTDTKKLIGTSGMFGIITQVTIKLMPLVKIKSTVTRMHDFELQREISSVLADPKVVLIQWLPDVLQAIIMTRESVPADMFGHAEFQIVENQPLLAPLGALTMEINQLENAKFGDQTFLDDLPIGIAETVLIPYYRDEFTKAPIPNFIPSVGRLPVMASSDCIPGPDFGCFWRMIPVNLIEVDMPIRVVPDFFNDVRKIVRQEVPTALPSVIGFATRFGGKSEGSPLDMAHDEDTAYVDIVTNKGPKQIDDASTYQHVFDQIEQLAFCKYKARPHWGKNSNRAFTNPNCPVKPKYPGFDSILEEAKQYDPEGIFLSPMLKEVIEPNQERTPGCAVRSECYCETDEHCGHGYDCVPGGTFSEYKVCKIQYLSLQHRIGTMVKNAVLTPIQEGILAKQG